MATVEMWVKISPPPPYLPPSPPQTTIIPMIPGPPPFLEHYLLEDPWPLVCLLGVAAFLAYIIASRLIGTPAARRTAAIIGLALLAAAGGVLALAALVTTTREQLLRETRSLVALTAPMQAPAIRELRGRFVPGTPVLDANGGVWIGYEALFERLDGWTRNAFIHKQMILSLIARTDAPGRGTVYLRLRTTAGVEGGVEMPVISEWLLDWQRGPDGQWRLSRVQCLRLGDGLSTNPCTLGP